jgi:hypothetical protein
MLLSSEAEPCDRPVAAFARTQCSFSSKTNKGWSNLPGMVQQKQESMVNCNNSLISQTQMKQGLLTVLQPFPTLLAFHSLRLSYPSFNISPRCIFLKRPNPAKLQAALARNTMPAEPRPPRPTSPKPPVSMLLGFWDWSCRYPRFRIATQNVGLASLYDGTESILPPPKPDTLYTSKIENAKTPNEADY